MKRCPHCAEEIQDAAKVCPHCGRKTRKLRPGFLGCLGLALLSAYLLTICGPETTKTPTGPEPPARVSDARQFAQTVAVSLDDSLEHVMSHMPKGMAPALKRNGNERVYTWTFPDGSSIEATFVPADRGAGLVLYTSEIRE